MSKFILCRVCLAYNIEMYPLNSTHYQEIYEKQTGTKLITDNRFEHVCHICNTLLLRFQSFLQMSQETEQFLIELSESGVEITPNNVSMLSTKHLSTKISNCIFHTEDMYNPESPKEVEAPTSTVEDVAVKIESVDYDDEYEQIDSHLIEDCNKQPEINTIEIEVPKIKISDIRVNLERIKLPIKPDPRLIHSCNFCKKRFHAKSNLLRHKCSIKPHRKYKFACELCDRRFRQKSMYLVHHRTHTGEKPFKCEMCPRVFNDKSNCRKHMRKHLNLKHACLLCDRSFSDRRYLLKHSIEHIL